MLQLASTSDLIQVVTSAVADVEPHASWVDNNAGVITPGRTDTPSITSATTTTVVGSPGASQQRRVVALSLRNNHGSTACDVTVQHFDGTDTATIIKVTLAAGEALVMDARGEWHHLDTNGAEYPRAVEVASRTQMEAATSLVVPVTPGRQHYHPGHPKFWCIARLVNAVPVAQAGYNLTSVTDTGAGRATFNVNVDFANANYSIQCQCERVSTSLTVTNLKYANIRNATPAVGSFEVEIYDGTATTHVQEDANSWSVFALGDAA